MSLNNISLPSQLVANLYHRSLVAGSSMAVPETPAVAFLGKGAKQILILVNQPDSKFLPDGELSFLTKVLSACQLGLMDVAIVNWDKSPKNLAAITEQIQTTSLLLFGLLPEQVGADVGSKPYSVTPLDDKKIMVSPPLAEIEKTKEAKSQLWVALKELFEL